MDRVVASWFGTGLILRKIRGSDAGSGTVGSLFALVVSLWLGYQFGWVSQLIAAVVVALAGLWVSGRLVETEGDAGWIVIDEAAGTILATVGLSLGPALVGFVVFRAADILKVPGVRQAEALPGGLGVTADDLVAGLFGLGVGHLLQTTVF